MIKQMLMSTFTTKIYPMQVHTFLYRLRVIGALFLFSMFLGNTQAQTLTVSLPSNYIICSGQVVQLFPEVFGGTGPYTYSWTPAANLSCSDCQSPDAFVSVTTTYQITVMDALGEEATATTVIIVDPPMTVDVGIAPPNCGSFGPIVATVQGGSAPFAYSWSTGQTTAIINPNAPGVYCVTVTNSNGCFATDCMTVTQGLALVVTGSATPSTCQSSQDGSITAVASGGTPPYTYSWSNGDTNPNPNNLSSGAYVLTVTDANGCTRINTFFVPSELVVDLANEVLDCVTGLATITGFVSQSGPNIIYQWTGPNGFTSSDLDAVVSESGEYTLRAINTDFPDCYSEYTTTVSSFDDFVATSINVELLGCNNYRLSGIVPPGSPTLQFQWTLPDGSTQNQQSIIATQTGTYQLRTRVAFLTDPACESYLTQFIDLEAQSCATLDGRIVHDADTDCVAASTEAGLNNWIVTAASATDTFHAITNANGEYSFSLPTGNYSISISGSSLWQTCASIPNISLPNPGDHATLDVPLEILVQCPELSVNLTTPMLRRCFNSSYYINVCNNGTEAATAPEVTLTLDGFLTYQSSQIPPSSVDGQTITWTLNDLEPGECRQFLVVVYVSCDATIGQTHCSEVTATPDPLCAPPSSIWSGASLELSGECDGNEVLFRVRNNGSGDLDQPVQYIVIEDAVMLMQEPGTITDLPVSDETLFSFPANGSTYTFQLQQAAFHPNAAASPTVAVEGCGLNNEGTFSMGWTSQFPLETTTLASDILCIPNIGSFDPNDKSALPVGYGAEHYLKAGDEINYLIRFQNTGTDTAFTIVIRDTLAPWLDMTSLRRGNSSHPYRLEIQGDRTLTFMFDNILLPDSTTNQEASNGFVDFKIRTLENTPLETRLENTAAIYFDFNEPVLTNTVFHTIGRNFVEVATWTSAPGTDVRWNVYPNPTPGTATLELASAPSCTKILIITDANGREMKRINFEGNQLILKETLPAGWYALRLLGTDGQSLGTGKLIVKGL